MVKRHQYEPPRLEVLGSVADLTLFGGGCTFPKHDKTLAWDVDHVFYFLRDCQPTNGS
jgi:hypothetical protein